MTIAQEDARTCILVLGMHRSGTSATAGALALCGVALGSELLAPGADNPKGYFEHERAVAIDERLLAALGSGWADARALPPGWEGGPAAGRAREEIDAFLGSEFPDALLFALKDPRMCRLLPAWLPVLRDRGVRVVALFVARDPGEVAASIEARNGWAPPLGELLWLRHVVEAEAATRGIARAAIAYDALLADPAGSLRDALSRVGVVLPQAPDGPLRAFADAGQRHQRKTDARAARHVFAGAVAQASAALDAVAAGGGAWDAIAAAGVAMDELWRHSGGTLEALAGMAMDVEGKSREMRDAMSAETARLQSELNAQLAWSDAAVREREALQAEAAGLRSSLAAQIAWAEAAVREREALQAEAAGLRSGLAAQVAWSEAAVREREALQAESAGLRSELAAQVRWSEQAVADWQARADRYERTLQELRGELEAIHASLAWRLSRPLRALESIAKRTLIRIPGKPR